MRALVIGNTEDLDPGLVGSALRRRGWHLLERLREEHASWPCAGGRPDLEGAALVLSLGSGWSTYWDHVADPVRAEQEVLRAAIDSGVGVLGICFGAQQLATVLGGSVHRAIHPEIGWHKVDPVGDAAGSAVVGGEWLQWHYDAVAVPPTVTVHAVTPVGPQMFVADRCVGVQFHPEATETVVRGWSTGDGEAELASVGLTPEALQVETARRMAEMPARCDRLVEWCLEQAVGREPGRGF